MKENYKKMSSVQLMFALITSVDEMVIKYVDGANPFVVNVGEDSVNIYIKNLSPAQLSNNNPDIWRIQLPVRDDFNAIKESDNLFVLFGYDSEREVFTSWNPYWCKQRLNVGKSVSLYSRLSLQQRVHDSGEIERMNLNNDGDVVCIPKSKIGEFLLNIKSYYPEVVTQVYPLDEFGKITCLDEKMRQELYPFVEDEEYPDYDEMINIVNGYYPKSILEKMSYADWIKIFKAETWKKSSAPSSGEQKSSSKFRTKTLRVIRPNGSVVQHKFVVDTYEEIIKESYPDLIMELGIMHAGVNIISKEYDERYSSSQRSIGGGYLLMTNSSTEQKYEDLVYINEQLELGYTIELLSLDGTPLTLEREPRPGHSTIKVTFPNGKVINHNRVFKTLVEVVEYAGPERVEKLNIIVCYKNLILRQPHDTYPVACKLVGDGWYVNTYTNTETKCSQIQLISDALGLGLKVEVVT